MHSHRVPEATLCVVVVLPPLKQVLLIHSALPLRALAALVQSCTTPVLGGARSQSTSLSGPRRKVVALDAFVNRSLPSSHPADNPQTTRKPARSGHLIVYGVGTARTNLERRMSETRQPGGKENPPARHIESDEMARIDLRLSDEEKAALQREAERQGLTLSDIARQSFAFYLGWLEGQAAQNDESPPA